MDCTVYIGPANQVPSTGARFETAVLSLPVGGYYQFTIAAENELGVGVATKYTNRKWERW